MSISEPPETHDLQTQEGAALVGFNLHAAIETLKHRRKLAFDSPMQRLREDLADAISAEQVKRAG